jgi:pyruvate dehydrogenase E1 component
MYFDEFKHQLPDIDPAETQEWLDALDQVHGQEGDERARFLLYKILKRAARQLHVGLPPLTQTRCINTISPEQEPFFPGDEEIERRIRRLIRWNAVGVDPSDPNPMALWVGGRPVWAVGALRSGQAPQAQVSGGQGRRGGRQQIDDYGAAHVDDGGGSDLDPPVAGRGEGSVAVQPEGRLQALE